MRMKALGVALLVVFSGFTTLYWIIDAPLRDASAITTEEEQLAFGRVVFLPDDTYTEEVEVSSAGFAVATKEIFGNASLNFVNKTDAELTITGEGADPFQLTVAAGGASPWKFRSLGETTVTAGGVDGSLVVTAGEPFLQPYGANCARCHGVDGTGGIGPNLHSLDLANKWLQTGGPQSLNNYVAWVITLGGVVRSGNVKSLMPAWGQAYGGTLTRQQIEALTAMIGTWAQETLDNPPPSPSEVPNTVEAGAAVYADTSVGCFSCHGADLEGGVGPNLQTIGSEMVTDLPVVPAHLDQMQADYDADPRVFLEKWIRDSSGNYNDGNPTNMPAFPVESLSDSALQALITFLLSHQ